MTRLSAFCERLIDEFYDVSSAGFPDSDRISFQAIAERMVREFIDDYVRFFGGKDAAHVVLAVPRRRRDRARHVAS